MPGVRPFYRLKGPVVGLEFESLVHLAGPFGALGDPGGEGLNLSVGESVALGGHGDFVIRVGDDFDEEAFFGVPGDDGSEAGVAAFEHQGAVVEAEAGLLLFLAVALKAVVGKDGSDVFLVGNFGPGGPDEEKAHAEAQGGERQGADHHHRMTTIGRKN